MNALILLSILLSAALGIARGADLAFGTDAVTGLCTVGSVWWRYAALGAVVLAAVLIAAGALFLIAPVWQPQRPAAAYVPAAVHTAAPEAPTLIDINTDTAEELTALPGLGPRKAAALVAYREAHGPFATLADAAAVKGISLRMTESWAGLAAANH